MTTLLDELKAQLQATNDPLDFIDLLNELSRAYLVRDTNVGRLFGEQAEALADEADYAQGVADSRRNQGFSLYYSGRYQDAIENGHDLVTRYVQLEDYDGLAQAYILIGLCAEAVSNYGEALEYHLKALDCARHLNHAEVLSDCYNNIAQVYAATEKYDGAHQHYQKAIELRLHSADQIGLADVYNNLAQLYQRQAKYDAALDYARRALILCEKLDYDVGIARTSITIGSIYTNRTHYAQAQEYLNQGRERANRNDWIAIELTALHQLARLHIKMHDMPGALAYLEQAQTRAEMLEQTASLADVHLDFATVYKLMNDHELALQHFMHYHELYRQRFTEERDAKLRSLEIAHATQTARVEAEYQRQRAEALEERRMEDRQYFERLNTMRDEFLHSTTHDLKNPLATIKTNLYLLRRTIRHPKGLSLVERIETQTERMHSLITDMLELAKLETGRVIEHQVGSMVMLVRDVMEMQRPNAEARQIVLHFDDPQGFPELRFDPRLMERALTNLVSNAIKYTEDSGEVQVQLACDSKTVTLAVRDTGVGIPEQDLPHIFDTFYRVDEAQSRSVDGTGLGLAIVRTIVEQHSGTITCESTLGQGSIFTMRLPIYLD